MRKRKTRKEASIAIITIIHLTLLYNLIAGDTHTGKTILAQKLLEKYKYPYLSIDQNRPYIFYIYSL
ncbi:hypothetical protein F2Z51_23420 [Bacteroides fragilis]|uniref:Uncharacterized protein n=1 Tax=Bacteroides fragilis TaxID=817 RepID=A0A833EUF3_BACFG|nr:hypothetical protein F2Z51_23420 [Bacteroides fragilis]KAA5168725.1 hypothetical protein F2Z29_20840 [Bacteroides fragilis]